MEAALPTHQIKPETYRLGATEIRKVGPEIWFINRSQIVWTHLGNIISSPEKTIHALRKCGFDIPTASLDFLLNR